jgi:F0F1-type ATP synthase assembly protein I
MAKKKHNQQKHNQQKKSNTAKPVSNAYGPAKKPVHKQRGTLLSVLIVLIGLHGILGAYIGYVTLKTEYVNAPWALAVLTLVSVAAIVAAVAIWYWKQWGITLYAVVCIIQAGVHLALTGSLLVVFYDILPVAILAYVINLQSKTKLFE